MKSSSFLSKQWVQLAKTEHQPTHHCGQKVGFMNVMVLSMEKEALSVRVDPLFSVTVGAVSPVTIL